METKEEVIKEAKSVCDYSLQQGTQLGILEILFDIRDLLAQSTTVKRLENHLRYPRGSGDNKREGLV